MILVIILGFRVITAYTPSVEETDRLPCRGAVQEIDFCENDLRLMATNEVPLLSIVEIAGKEYLVADRTNSRYRYRYDILKRSKKEALQFGRQTLEVKLKDRYAYDTLHLAKARVRHEEANRNADRKSRTAFQEYLRLAYRWLGNGGVSFANAESPCSRGN